MQIIRQVAYRNPKLCNLEPGTAVMSINSAGFERGPFILMSAHTYQDMGDTPALPPPVSPKASVCWNEGTDARLLDPATGAVYTIHASSRGRVLKNAAFVVNDHEEA